MKKIEHIIFIAALGFVIGALMGLSVRHPVTEDVLEKYDTICNGTKPILYRINLTGDVLEVKCSNNQIIKFSREIQTEPSK